MDEDLIVGGLALGGCLGVFTLIVGGALGFIWLLVRVVSHAWGG